jgi:hypothetical protein
MKQNEMVLQESLFPPIMAEEAPSFDRHAYLRPWRYFRFYVLYEPASRRTCWLPEGYDQ